MAGSRGDRRVEVVGFDLRRTLLNVLGEDHYPFAESLYHELVANAWDEDAARVEIIEEVIQPASPGRQALVNITISDDGNGMDLDGLREYFTVGESSKPARVQSARKSRPLIGRIGVGKVSILKVARRWTVETERHPKLGVPNRLVVHVDVDEWIEGRSPGFAVEVLDPTGRHGTTIILEEVKTRMREDRILRHLQRLPLGEDFLVFRNGDLVAPRTWWGIERTEVNETIEWEEGDGTPMKGQVRGEIWVRPVQSGKNVPYVQEPATEQQGLSREPAGIEVRVNRDVIKNEFFGHDTHAHGVNRILGWVDADWLPILGNRTDFVRDHPAFTAFFLRMKEIFDNIYRPVKAERDSRTKRSAETSGEQPASDQGRAPAGNGKTIAVGSSDPIESRYSEAVGQVLQKHPEFAPLVEKKLNTRRGQPAKDRIYPARGTGERRPFIRNEIGEDLAVGETQVDELVRQLRVGSALRTSAKESENLEVAEVVRNTAAGIRVKLSGLGSREALYRWNLADVNDLQLEINTDHKLYEGAGRPGSAPHRVYCSIMMSLALAERLNPVSGTTFSDLLETVSYEILSELARRR